MAKVLRGGKWGTLSRDSGSRSQQRADDSDEPTAITDEQLEEGMVSRTVVRDLIR